MSTNANAFAPAAAWWRGLAARERTGLTLAAVVLLGYLVWAVAVGPALKGLARAPVEHDLLEAQYQTMQRLATESQQLRATPPLAPDAAVAALKAATERLGDKGRLMLQDDRVMLSVNGAGPQALRDWLAEARSGARARPLEANLTRSGAGYNGVIVLAIGGGA